MARYDGAEYGNRTRAASLGSSCTAIILTPLIISIGKNMLFGQFSNYT